MKIREQLKKKRVLIPLLFLLVVFSLNMVKHEFVFYLPFNIPGDQTAATIPPFGIFIEEKFETENPKNPCAVINHERIHWNQYKRMGLTSFYYNYLKCYFVSGRFNHWMEEEAREPCFGKKSKSSL
jgi:hypothetical protein